VSICRAEACQSLGGERLYTEVKNACATGNQVTVEAVYCLGNCALSPAALIDGKLHGRLDTEKTLALVRK
jgi:formate dehydrogenase subunit gamma